MAKKKKSKKAADTRGYSQGGVPSSSVVANSSSKPTTTTSRSSSSKPPTHHDVNNNTIDLPQTSASSSTDTAVANNISSSTTTQSPASSSSSATHKKFHNKLSTITTKLLSLQFTLPQITKAVCKLQYEITVESALDYLCLHLSSDELPNLFCDEKLMYDLVGGNGDNGEEDGDGRRSKKLTVVKVDKSIVRSEENISSGYDGGDDGEKKESGGVEGNILIVPRHQQQQEEDKALLEEEKQRIKEEEERKNWLLRQYEYEQDDNDDNNGSSNKEQPPKASHHHHQQQQQELSPDEIQLQTTQSKLQILEEDLANDANNYMRSKVEMKQLRNEVKKLKQVVAGLERKVEKRVKAEERKRRNELEVMNGEGTTKEENEEEEGVGMMFDLFGNQNDDDDDDDGNYVVGKNEQDDSSPPSTTATAATSATKSIEDYTIPTGWTGTTPQKKLDELLKKQQLPRAKYTKLPMNSGFKLTLITTDNSTNKDNGSNTKKKRQQQKHQQTIEKQYEAKHCNFTKTSSLKDYLATLALYELDPTLPLYSVFPMPFRTLWLSWVNEKREMKVMEQKVVEEEWRMQIDHLICMIESMKIDKKKQGGSNGDGGEKKKKSDEISEKGVNKGRDDLSGDDIVDDWEAEEIGDDSTTPIATTTIMNKAPTSAGIKLQKEFIHRTSTPAYQKMKAIRDTLPMSQYRQTILDTIAAKEHRVMILQADTGAGKSTQCAQYILEQALLDGIGDTVNIICTQPRRVAATSVAERVADEMVDPLGNIVGYQIRMESKRSSRTKLLFCTTGVVLRRLQDDPNLKGVTHVIVDEVHERQQQTDVLLIVLRQLLRTTRPDLKVILMSATMDEKLFCSFFQGAPLVSVPGRTFPVNNYFLEDLLEATNHLIEESSRYALREDYRGEKTAMMVTTRSGERRKQMVDCYDNPLSMELDEDWYPGFKMSTRLSLWRANEEVINYDLVEDVLALLLVKKDYSALAPPEGADMSSTGSILVFLPGLGEIKALAERLEGNRSFRSCDIIPMHSTLSSKDQRRAFIPAAKGTTKIIIFPILTSTGSLARCKPRGVSLSPSLSAVTAPT